jgi:triacylglycerol lipase
VRETVVLLHGIGRTKLSMQGMERALKAAGFDTFSLTYPSRRAPIAELADFVNRRVAPYWERAGRLHFVTHSMGGLVAAHLLERGRTDTPPERIGRVVMLAPPLRGSEVADALSHLPPYGWVMGPAALELTTRARQSFATPHYELGVIAGTVGWPYALGSLVLPKPHDGRVALSRTRVAGLADHIVVPATHTFLTNRPDVQRHTIHFLQTGAFASR